VFLTIEAPVTDGRAAEVIGVVFDSSTLDPNNSGGTMTGCFFGGDGHWQESMSIY
jgi:hypothetical protein